MSIAKKREKRAKNDSPQEKKFSLPYLVSEEEMRDFIGSLRVCDVDAAAARLQLVADLTADTENLDQAAIQRIRRLIGQSRKWRYQRIMRTMVAAIEKGPKGIESAHLTASRIVEKAFRWTQEHLSALNLYKDKLRSYCKSM